MFAADLVFTRGTGCFWDLMRGAVAGVLRVGSFRVQGWSDQPSKHRGGRLVLHEQITESISAGETGQRCPLK